MTDRQNPSSAKKKFRLGVFFTLAGLVILSPLIYRSPSSFEGQSAVGPFFGIAIGITFLIVGFLRISKSQQSDDPPSTSVSQHNDAIETNVHETPKFIKWVALSPSVPLCVGFILELGCHLLHLNVSGGIRSLMEALAYLGAFGWIVSLPIAGLLKMIYSAYRDD
jgi:hypothetical protein